MSNDDGVGATHTARYTVTEKDTVGAAVPGMPMVAATPYLVRIAEVTAFEIPKPFLEPGQITVGARVVIDHLGASKVGAELVVEATLKGREKNRFYFDITIKDGERIVGKVEHTRAAVSKEKLMAALG